MALGRRITAVTLMTTALLIWGAYFTLFHHPPASVILSNNQKEVDSRAYQLDASKPHTIAEISQAAWAKWLHDSKHTAIGDVYDSNCDDEERVLVGKIILLPNPETGGVKARTYINTTFDKSIPYGTIHALVHYNGKEFYNNKLDMCTAEDNDPDRLLKCPLEKGTHYFVKDVNISPLVPKGEYSVKSWLVDQSQRTVLCTDMLFKL